MAVARTATVVVTVSATVVPATATVIPATATATVVPATATVVPVVPGVPGDGVDHATVVVAERGGVRAVVPDEVAAVLETSR